MLLFVTQTRISSVGGSQKRFPMVHVSPYMQSLPVISLDSSWTQQVSNLLYCPGCSWLVLHPLPLSSVGVKDGAVAAGAGALEVAGSNASCNWDSGN